MPDSTTLLMHFNGSVAFFIASGVETQTIVEEIALDGTTPDSFVDD